MRHRNSGGLSNSWQLLYAYVHYSLLLSFGTKVEWTSSHTAVSQTDDLSSRCVCLSAGTSDRSQMRWGSIVS